MFDTGAGVPGRDTAPLVASLRSAPVTSGHCRTRGGWSRSVGEMSESANTGTAAAEAAWHKPSLDNPGHSRSCEE